MRSLDSVIDQPIDRAENAVREALAAQGLGVLIEIDVAATFEAKLGVTRSIRRGPGAAVQRRAARRGLPDLRLDR
jgi:hypothetical protein